MSTFLLPYTTPHRIHHPAGKWAGKAATPKEGSVYMLDGTELLIHCPNGNYTTTKEMIGKVHDKVRPGYGANNESPSAAAAAVVLRSQLTHGIL